MTRFMCALIILKAAEDRLLPALGTAAPEIVWEPTVALMKRIAAGERADGLFAIDGAIDQLVTEGIVDPASVVPVAQAQFGIAVHPDLPPFPLENAEDLIGALRAAPSICYSRAGASGIYFETLIDRLGIGDEVRAKSIVIPQGLTAAEVAAGRAVLAIQQMSELRAVEGVRIAGPLPPDCQQTTDFSAAIFADAQDRAGAERFLAVLTSEEARQAYLDIGLKLRF